MSITSGSCVSYAIAADSMESRSKSDVDSFGERTFILEETNLSKSGPWGIYNSSDITPNNFSHIRVFTDQI